MSGLRTRRVTQMGAAAGTIGKHVQADQEQDATQKRNARGRDARSAGRVPPTRKVAAARHRLPVHPLSSTAERSDRCSNIKQLHFKMMAVLCGSVAGFLSSLRHPRALGCVKYGSGV